MKPFNITEILQHNDSLQYGMNTSTSFSCLTICADCINEDGVVFMLQLKL